MHFFCKLIPPRTTFGLDMTEDENRLMQEHAIYWRQYLGKGHVVAFGVVADPAGIFGAGMVEFDSVEAVKEFTAGDPTILSDRGFTFEVHHMPFGVVTP